MVTSVTQVAGMDSSPDCRERSVGLLWARLRSMDNIEEFEFWCAEYRDNERMSPAETRRLFENMCDRGNHLAIAYSRSSIDGNLVFRPDEPDLVDLLGNEQRTGPISGGKVEGSEDDDWSLIVGAIQDRFDSGPGRVSAEYTSDWPEIAGELKEMRGWKCEICSFQMRGSGSIQVHHVDHDKSNNEVGNLQVLCAICHGSKHGGTILWPHGVTREAQDMLVSHHRDRSRFQLGRRT